MGRPNYREGGDGFLVRDAERWTEEKLMILEEYIPNFAKATKRATRWGGWYGLDLFAGGGLNYSVTHGREIRGSPLIMLEAGPPKAATVLLCEKGRDARMALKNRIYPYADRARIFAGDANHLVRNMLAEIPVQAPTFAFADPEGADLAWSTVRTLAEHKRGHARTKIEQLILFPTDMGFIRLLDRRQQNEAGAEKVDRIMPGPEWRQTWDARAADAITADEARTRYVDLYADGLRDLGYREVLDREVPAEGRRQYFLIFATDSGAGDRIMDHCFDQVRARTSDELARPRLFELPQPPRRRRT